MAKVTIIETIAAFGGTLGLGGLLTLVVGKMMGKKKEEIEIAFTESKIYRELIAELKQDRDERVKREQEKDNKIEELRRQIKDLKDKVVELINLDKEKNNTIEEQKKNILRWEKNCIKLESIVKKERKNNAILIKELEEFRSGIKKNDSSTPA